MTRLKSHEFVRIAADAASDRKGEEISAIDVRDLSSITDCFLFIGANSHIHVRALEDAIREALKKAGAHLIRTDGQRGHLWRALDYGNFIIHIMEEKTRDFYSLERLWAQGKPFSLSTINGRRAKAPPSRRPRRKRSKK